MHQAYFVYKLTCQTNGKIYIGATRNLKARIKGHRYDARHGSQSPLHKAMRKHGVDSFSMDVIYEAVTEQEMFGAEVRLIQEYNSRNRHVGYNICAGGEGASHQTSDETKKTLSELSKAIWAAKTQEEMAEFKEKMRKVGANISEATRQKRSAAAKAQHADPEKEAHMKAALFLAAQSIERRKGNSERAKARWADPVFRMKMQSKHDTPSMDSITS
jgi:group I intron endonuclease